MGAAVGSIFGAPIGDSVLGNIFEGSRLVGAKLGCKVGMGIGRSVGNTAVGGTSVGCGEG